MKSRLIVAIIVLLVIGCKKEEHIPIYFPGNMTFGRMDADKEGKAWVASSAAFYNEYNPALFGIIASTFTEGGFLRETLVFNKIPLKVGRYEVTKLNNDMFDGKTGASYNTSEDDGDVSEDSYDVDESATDNYIEITLVDTIANMAKGNFTVSFNIVTSGGKRNPSNPDKVKFSNGTFDVEFFK